jgi:hypothetical protein
MAGDFPKHRTNGRVLLRVAEPDAQGYLTWNVSVAHFDS